MTHLLLRLAFREYGSAQQANTYGVMSEFDIASDVEFTQDVCAMRANGLHAE